MNSDAESGGRRVPAHGTAVAHGAAAPAIDTETLARATLTFCLDSADAVMHALLKGAPSATEALALIIDSRPGVAKQTAVPARTALERMFSTGLTRWDKPNTPQNKAAFRRALERWHHRVAQLPTLDFASLDDWFTMGGAQWIISPDSPYWPTQLSDLATRQEWAVPLCLWGRGDPGALVSCERPIAIVGSRGVDDYGRAVAHDIAEHVAAQGHLVVSGGAMGADAAAHWGAIDAMRGVEQGMAGRTVAVFAGGLNHIGPRCNDRLFDAMVASGGALISELCPGTIPEARRFLMRNRIIAALASSVIVAQARLRSGALSTATYAADISREVYAVPGDINKAGNAGCNSLIHDGKAMIVCSTHAEDMCHERHPPRVVVNETGDAAEGRDCGEGAAGNGGDVGTERDVRARMVMDAVRLCMRRHEPPTFERIRQMMASKDADRPVWDVLETIGEMELAGTITMTGGVITPAIDTG